MSLGGRRVVGLGFALLGWSGLGHAQVSLGNEALIDEQRDRTQRSAHVLFGPADDVAVVWNAVNEAAGRIRLLGLDGSKSPVLTWQAEGVAGIHAFIIDRERNRFLIGWPDAEDPRPSYQWVSTAGGLQGPPRHLDLPGVLDGKPDYAPRPGGGFVVSIAGPIATPIPISNQRVFGQIYDLDSHPVSDVFQVSTDELLSQFPPVLSANPLGSFVVVWDAEEDPQRPGGDVFGRVYGPAGHALALPFALGTTSEGDQNFPDVAMAPDGSFVAVWSSPSRAPGELEGQDVFLRRFAADGTPYGPEVRLSESSLYSQWAPQIAMDSRGDFVVVWTEALRGGRFRDLWARLFRADGVPLSPDFPVNQVNPNLELSWPSVALSDSGQLAFAWESNWPFDPNYPGTISIGIAYRRFLATCPADATMLPLRGGRFLACARWHLREGAYGAAVPESWSDEAGGFTFFSPSNLEVLIKVLDGCAINGSFWVFAAGLTDVGVDLAVVDTWTGETRSYHNRPGEAFQPIRDVTALGGCSASAPRVTEELAEMWGSHRPQGSAPLCR